MTTTRWNTERIARKLGYLPHGEVNGLRIQNARASVRSRVKRWQDEGRVFDVEIDGKTGEKLYLASEILEAQATSPGKGHRAKRERKGS